ncbi:MAG: alpha-L-fucosidase [Lentisphaerota bacterium]
MRKIVDELNFKAPKHAVQQFKDWRYGMFIHYGIYSQAGRGEWLMSRERIPFEEYSKLAQTFAPAKDVCREWAMLARLSGMKYMCLTTRHHDGFCLFDTRTTGYNSVKSPCQRDIVKEYVESCRKEGLGVGLYYSVGNWSDAGCIAGPKNKKLWSDFIATNYEQLHELMTNYGKIDYIFYDGCPPPETIGMAELNDQIRKWQPDILISERGGTDEDIPSSEGHTFTHANKLWESCFTINGSWAYNKFDHNFKTTAQVIDILTFAVHNNGNLLLNIGPMGDGSIQQENLTLLSEVAEWLKINGEAIYNTEPFPFNYIDQELSTGRGQYIYIVLGRDYGSERVICGIKNQVQNITLLETGENISFKQDFQHIYLTGLSMPEPAGMRRVLRLEIAGEPEGVVNPLMDSSRFRID